MRGGYQKPSSPAVASGPGAMSKRTDGGPAGKQGARYVSDQPYGEGQELMTAQQSAPMAAAAPTIPEADMSLVRRPQAGLFDPTERPLTQGMPFGEGAGPEVLATAGQGPSRSKLFAALPQLQRAAERADASPELRALVTYLRSQI